jgi:hypothetical protein
MSLQRWLLRSLLFASVICAPAGAFAQGKGGGGGRGGGGGGTGSGGPVSTPKPTGYSPDDTERNRRFKENVYSDLQNQDFGPGIQAVLVPISSVQGRYDSVEVNALLPDLRGSYIRLHRGDTTVVWVNAQTPDTKLRIRALAPQGDVKSKTKSYMLSNFVDAEASSPLVVKPGRPETSITLSDSTTSRVAKKAHVSSLDVPYGKHKVSLCLTDGPGDYMLVQVQAYHFIEKQQVVR